VKRSKVLWIEDSAHFETSNLAAPVIMSGLYNLSVALDASDGMRQLRQHTFDAVVVDIRLPPGADERWIEVYRDLFRSNKAARLGLKLLEVIFHGAEAPWHEEFRAPMNDARRYGVLSVESRSDLATDLKRLGIGVYYDKGDGEDPDILLQTIRAITRQTS
jgi:DNA-binding NarL/FixJ family response regulator